MTGGDAETVRERITRTTRETFEISPEVIVLERGTLAKEFESAVKVPRFVDRRE